MILGNNFFKINEQGEVVPLTTDSIPEGNFNKYCLEYADGKTIGDIVLRPNPDEILCHSILNGQLVHAYQNKDFYEYCLDCKQKAQTNSNYEFFDKTEQEYESFLQDNVWEQTGENYCPYFVISESSIEVYEVEKDGLVGYTPLVGNQDEEVSSGFIYDDIYLTNTISNNDDWFYTGNQETSVDKYVKLPTFPTYLNGNTKLFFFIITKSRVNDDTTSIRSVSVGDTCTIDYNRPAYVKNVGTIQNLVLEFGIPVGTAATIQVGTVTSGDIPNVVNVGTEHEAILNFTLARGAQGIAGGVIELVGIGSELPTTGNISEKFYNTSDNKIYIFSEDWEQYSDANEGIIYLYNSNIYHFNGTEIEKVYSEPQIDNKTIVSNSEGKIEVVGTYTKQGTIVYDWIGTTKEWEIGRSNGTILDSFICFITDD